MKKIIAILCVIFLVAGCTPKKPSLDSTQIVDGKSIVIPPEFDVKP